MPPEDAILVPTGDLAGPAVLSRDGSKVAFVAKQNGEEQRLFIRSMDHDDPQSIPGTAGATFPFWSWDGKSIGYFARGELKRYDLSTRINRVVCSAPAGRGGAWLADGRIVFAAGFQTPLSSVPAEGGTPVDTTRHTSHRWPEPTPDGRNFIYIAVSHESGKLAESTMYLHRDEGADVEFTRAQFAGQIVSGKLLVLRDDTLYASPFDYTTGTLSDAATPIVKGVMGDLTTWRGSFSANSGGTLIFQEATQDSVKQDREYGGSGPTTFGESTRMVILNRDGRPMRTLADGVAQNTTSISPHYEYIAISGAPEGTLSRSHFDIWLYRLAGYTVTPDDSSKDDASGPSPFEEPPVRLTFLEGSEVSPQWSTDGEWIAYESNQSGDWEVYVVPLHDNFAYYQLAGVAAQVEPMNGIDSRPIDLASGDSHGADQRP